jgi:hypothetical protein
LTERLFALAMTAAEVSAMGISNVECATPHVQSKSVIYLCIGSPKLSADGHAEGKIICGLKPNSGLDDLHHWLPRRKSVSQLEERTFDGKEH